MTRDASPALSGLPDFFIVGAPKCGTTAMYDYLRQHPQIFMPFHKEPLFFGSDLTRRYGQMSEVEYAALFADARPGQRVGEASAWYLYSRCAAEEIKSAVPDASIIIMLRNPVDVMYAQHSQLLFNRQEDLTDFSEALAAEEDRVCGLRLPGGSHRPENLFYRRTASFSDQVRRYFDAFGRERVHVIIHDDLKADLPETFRATLKFLGVADNFTPSFHTANANKRARNALIQRLVWDPPLLRRLVPRLRRYPLMHQLRARILAANSVDAPREPLSQSFRTRLEAMFAPEIQDLGELVGRDLSQWAPTEDRTQA